MYCREGDIESVFHFLSPKAKQDRFGDSIKYLQDMLRNDIYLPLLSINDWEILQSGFEVLFAFMSCAFII